MLTKRKIIADIRKRPAVIDVHSHVGVDPAAYLTAQFPYCVSVEDQALRMRMFGVDYAVAFPFIYTEYFSLGALRRATFRRKPARGRRVHGEVTGRDCTGAPS